MKIEIATAAELRAARASFTVRKRSITCGRPMIPSDRPMVSERLLIDSVRFERSGSTTLAPNCFVASSIGPIGFQPVRLMTATNTASTMIASRLVLKIWM